MLFSSISFIYGFLPSVLAIYFICPARLRNAALFISSCVFYFYGDALYLPLMLGVALSGYIHARLIARRRSRALLISSIVVSLGALILFKYFSISAALPIGISFYTFQTLSYTIDVYRGDVKAAHSPIDFLTYVTLFPQLIAGPIVRYKSVADELCERKTDWEGFSAGAMRFTVGLCKKVLVANLLGEVCAACAAASPSVLSSWLRAVAFMLQIYFDFSGYSDMAIGMGRMFGFHFPENFNYPFIAASITDFWRRWHITLGGWFRDYVYIPLGGNRVSRARFILNIAVVWALTGLWHGAALSFVVWGVYFAVFLVAEKLIVARLLKKLPRILSHAYLLFIVLISFVIFDAPTLFEAGGRIAGMFGGGAMPLVNTESLYYLKSFATLIVIAAIGATPIPARVFARCKPLAPALTALGLILATAFLIDGSFNPFLYFRF